MDGLLPVGLDTSITSAGLSSIQPPQHRGHPAMDAAAKILGMSSSDLRTALRSGQSLAQIASSKGVSESDLESAMAQAITAANPGISADQAARVAAAIATRTPPAPPTDTTETNAAGQTRGHHHHHGHRATAAGMEAAAQTLGMSEQDLTKSLQAGQSLASLASSKGVSQSDLVAAIAAALQKADSSLSSDQANELATRLVTMTPESPGNNQPWSAGAASPAPTTFQITA